MNLPGELPMTAEEIAEAQAEDLEWAKTATPPMPMKGKGKKGKDDEGRDTLTYRYHGEGEDRETWWQVTRVYEEGKLVGETTIEEGGFGQQSTDYVDNRPILLTNEGKGDVASLALDQEGEPLMRFYFSMGSTYCRIYDTDGKPHAFPYETCDSEYNRLNP